MLEYYSGFIIKLVLACVLGGIIGYERESMHRPAGFRTHILVCVGAALVMVTSEFIFNKYYPRVNADPARLGAQVISGIGFLGAGTIIREGFNVKGLTTAASLWAVSCVGIAVGIGFYEGAIAATVLIYITLLLLRKMEKSISSRKQSRVFYIQAKNIPGIVSDINGLLEKSQVPIHKMEFITNESDNSLTVKLLVKAEHDFASGNMMSELQNLELIKKVYEE